jgi:hypothetical protein
MHKMVEWSENLDLNDFYAEANRKGFVNNSSQKSMVDCFKNEEKWKVWILYQGNRAIGSVAAHSFDDVMGPNSYRVLSRTCTFTDASPYRGLITAQKWAAEHQSFVNQFLLPTCLSWTGKKNIYATSNNNDAASQKLVHKYYFNTLEKTGITKKIKDVYYRGTIQTIWQIDADAFEESLSKYPRWE